MLNQPLCFYFDVSVLGASSDDFFEIEREIRTFPETHSSICNDELGNSKIGKGEVPKPDEDSKTEINQGSNQDIEEDDSEDYTIFTKFKSSTHQFLCFKFLIRTNPTKPRISGQNVFLTLYHGGQPLDWSAKIALNPHEVEEEEKERKREIERKQEEGQRQKEDKKSKKDLGQPIKVVSKTLTFKTIPDCLRALIRELDQYLEAWVKNLEIYKEKPTKSTYKFDVHPCDLWLIKDLVQNVSLFHPRVFQEGSQKLIIGTINNADYSSFKQTFEKSLQVLKERDSKMPDNGFLIGKKARMQRLYDKVYKTNMLVHDMSLKEHIEQGQSPQSEEGVFEIRDNYLLSLSFRKPILFLPFVEDFFDMRTAALSIGSPSDPKERLFFIELLEKRWAYLKERDSKMPDNGYLIGKNARMQRLHDKSIKSFELYVPLEFKNYEDQIEILSKCYVIDKIAVPKQREIAFWLGITDPSLASKVYDEFQEKIKILQTKYAQQISQRKAIIEMNEETKADLESGKKKRDSKNKLLKERDIPSEFIPLFNIQIGPQVFSSGFRIYYLDIFYSERLQKEVSIIEKKISSLLIEYRLNCKTWVKSRIYPIPESEKTMFKASSTLADSTVIYSDFKNPKELETFSNTLLSNQANQEFVLFLPKGSNLDNVTEKILAKFEVKIVQEDLGSNQIAIHISQSIKRKIADKDYWQDLYREAFLDFDKFRDPLKKHFDYDGFINMLITMLDLQEFDPDFLSKYIQPYVQKMETREDVIEAHYNIMKNLEAKTEELSKKIKHLEYKIEFPQTISEAVTGNEEETQFNQETKRIKEELKHDTEENKILKQYFKYLKISALISVEETSANRERAYKKRLFAVQSMLLKKSKNDREKEAKQIADEYQDFSQKLQAFQKEDEEIENFRIKFEKYQSLTSETNPSNPSKDSIEILKSREIIILEQWLSQQLVLPEEFLIIKFLKESVLSPANQKAKPLQGGPVFDELYSSLEERKSINQTKFDVNLINGFLRKVNYAEEIREFIEEKKSSISRSYMEEIQKVVKDTLKEVLEKKYQLTLQNIIIILDQLINELTVIKGSLNIRRAENARTFRNEDFFMPEFYKFDFDSDRRNWYERPQDQQIREQKEEQKAVLSKKPSLKEKREKQSSNSKSEIPKSRNEILESKDGGAERKGGINKTNLKPEELEQLKDTNNYLLKLQIIETNLNLIDQIKKKLCLEAKRISSPVERAIKIHLGDIRGKSVELRTKIDKTKTEKTKMENEFNQIELVESEGNLKQNTKLFLDSLPSDDQLKVRDYLVVFQRTIEVYYRSSQILEGGLFERKKSKDAVDWALGTLDILLSGVPFGSYISKALTIGKGIYDYGKELNLKNNYRTFSDLILNSDNLGFILQSSALELARVKKDLISNLNDTIHKSFIQLDEKHKTLFIKEEKLYRGLDTGAKKMAAIDAAFIIANSYVDFLAVEPRIEKVDLNDIYNTRKTINLFVDCGKKIDQTKYLDLLKDGVVKLDLTRKKHENQIKSREEQTEAVKKVFKSISSSSEGGLCNLFRRCCKRKQNNVNKPGFNQITPQADEAEFLANP